jgi:hypothetical protein
MCFGMTTTQQTTNTPSSFVQGAGQTAFNFAQNLATQPFNAPLLGTAGFTPQQLQSFAQVGNLASAPNAGNPFYNTIANDYANYGAAPAASIGAPSVLGATVNPAAASLNQYIDPNLQRELQPTLDAITRQAAIAKTGPGGVGAAATAAGAFGDARQGVENANVDEAAMRQAAQATGQAYQSAFQNAANLRGIDISNLIGTQTANAGLNEQALARVLGSGNALTNLAQYTTGTGLNLAQALGQAGTQQQQLAQQQLGNLYNQQLQNLLGPYQYQIPALNSTLAALAPTQPSTQTVQQPNNAGWQLAGALGGALLGGLGTGFGQGMGLGTFGNLFGGGKADGQSMQNG